MIAQRKEKRRIRPLTAVLIAVLAAVLVMLLLFWPGRQTPAGASTPDPGTKTGSTSFDLGYVGVYDLAASTSTRVCYQYYPQDGWRQYNILGKLQYGVTVNVIWCLNQAQTKVVALPQDFCIDMGGYFVFDNCKAIHGSLGYASLGLDTKWHYHFVINGLIFVRTPELVFSVGSYGHVWGTFYWA